MVRRGISTVRIPRRGFIVSTPEELARGKIDALLTAAGWSVLDKKDFNRNASLGVALREAGVSGGEADYLLFVAGKAAGVIEAKPAGTTLSGVAEQSQGYMGELPPFYQKWSDPLRFGYESTGDETYFRDNADPKPRSRRVFAFHKPETLHGWLLEADTLRARLQAMPPLPPTRLRDCQVDAIAGLEKSLAKADPRALIQAATGAGKTYTACNFSYRLIKFARVRRVLFLVDRRNLGRQALTEFQTYRPPDDPRLFTDLYPTQLLSGRRFDKDAKVVITTIQRVYAMLKGEELAEEVEEASSFEGEDGPEVDVAYNRDLPIEAFDVIVTDECHRSIYGRWRQVLEYFDAFIVGLTATPSRHTLGFFNQNLVSEYPYERSVADGVNVGYEVYRVRTDVGGRGGKVEAGYSVGVRDKRTRKTKYQELDQDLVYAAQDLDRSVTVPNQIRTVLETYKQRLFTDLFPGRSGKWVPKTLIFAKDDHHAEEIVTICREVFGEGNRFCKKITYRTTGESPEDLIKSFRVDPYPRIAVTVDMVATGTDIKPVEVVIFMRDVKSDTYYEQMKGRGCRTIEDADLATVTPDANTKTRFVLVDAVGVTESRKTASQPLERRKSLAFDTLVDRIAFGQRDDDMLSSLAARLAALDRAIDDEDRAKIKAAAGGKSLRDLGNGLLDAIDADKIDALAAARFGAAAAESQRKAIQDELKETACAPFDDPALRETLKEIKRKSEIVIDEVTTDKLVSAEFDLDEARRRVDRFQEFLAKNKDELLALQILYGLPYGTRRLTYAAVKELADKLTSAPWHLTTATVWQAYKRLEAAKVRGAPADRLMTEIIALVRFATGQTEVLEPFAQQVEQRFNLWIGRQKKAGREFTEEQLRWLRLIKDHIAANAAAEPGDLGEVSTFADQGGIVRARALFGAGLNAMLDELNGALVA
jgi:type I restriction enzyme R subunit